MITLENDRLVFSFPEVHEDARLAITFQRTLRIPDDGRDYPLPPGLGNFPLRHVDDFGERVPANWRPRGGVMMPMFQSEALWISFGHRWGGYPFAIKVATGKINAVDGKPWASGLARDPQNYLAAPPQPWLDGYCVAKGVVRQFVAMPLGEGYTAEEQITGEAEHGGIQIVAYPMKRALYEEMQRERNRSLREMRAFDMAMPAPAQAAMGLAPGGRMRQHIYDDEHGVDAWDQARGSRCFVAIANSLSWRAITGEVPPSLPPTARDYAKAKLPWFDYYADAPAVQGAGVLANLLSVVGMGKKKGETPLPENELADPSVVVPLGLAERGPRPVREAALE